MSEPITESALRCLDRALAAMNHAVKLTRDHGPAVAIEYIADYLNDTDRTHDDDAVFHARLDRIEAADTAPEAWEPHGIGLDGRCRECDGPAAPPPGPGDWLEEVRAREERASEMVARICAGERWTMRVPVDEARDSDTVIAASLADVPALVGALRAVEALADEWESRYLPLSSAAGQAWDFAAEVRAAVRRDGSAT